MRAKRATFTFWVDKNSLKMPKIVNFGEFFKTLNLRSNSVTRQVTFSNVENAKIEKFKCDTLRNKNSMFARLHRKIPFYGLLYGSFWAFKRHKHLPRMMPVFALWTTMFWSTNGRYSTRTRMVLRGQEVAFTLSSTHNRGRALEAARGLHQLLSNSAAHDFIVFHSSKNSNLFLGPKNMWCHCLFWP